MGGELAAPALVRRDTSNSGWFSSSAVTPCRVWASMRSASGTGAVEVDWQPPMVRNVVNRPGAWTAFGTRLIYDSRWVRLGLVDVQAPNGDRWEYHVVRLPRIAVALLVNKADEALMLWRYRFPTEQWGYELLGGLVEEGEDPAATAAREAVEESGWAPRGAPEELISFEPLPGSATAPMHVFLWREFEHVGEPTDTEEVGRLEWVPMSRVTELAARGELLGSGTLVALLYYLASRGGGQDQGGESP